MMSDEAYLIEAARRSLSALVALCESRELFDEDVEEGTWEALAATISAATRELPRRSVALKEMSAIYAELVSQSDEVCAARRERKSIEVSDQWYESMVEKASRALEQL